MNPLKKALLSIFDDILNLDLDLNSWAGLHVIEFCKEQNYENPTVEKIVKCFSNSENILYEFEELGFKYRRFAERFVASEERESFLDKVYRAHHEHFGNQEVKGLEL